MIAYVISKIRGIERGGHNVAAVNLVKIAIALDILIKDLFKK